MLTELVFASFQVVIPFLGKSGGVYLPNDCRNFRR